MVEGAHDITEEPVESVEDDAIDEVGTVGSASQDSMTEEASSEEAPPVETTSEDATTEETGETTPDEVEHALRDLVQETRIVEALLFAATEPVSTDFLAERLPEGTDIGAILEDIRNLYADRGVNLARVAGKWSLRTAEDLSPHLRIERKVSRKPSRAAVESLAIIAYHQPVTRSEVEEIRGVSVSKGSFDVLLEAGWIKPVGRRRTPGRPTTWGTTPVFLEEFGLDSLADLPGIDELKASGLLDTRPAGTIIGDSGEMYNDAEAEGAPEDDEPEALDDGDDAALAASDDAEDDAGDDTEEVDVDAVAEMEAEAEAEAEQEPDEELEPDDMPERETQAG